MPGRFRRTGIKVPPTKSEVQAHELARRVLETGALRIGSEFVYPDDDWEPTWLVLTKTQGTIVSPGRGVEKYEMTDYVAGLARRWGAVALAHLHSSWLVVGPELAQRAADQHGSTEGIDERQEVLLLATYTVGNARHYIAHIERHENAPPTLAPFELLFDTAAVEDDTHVTGAMVDPLMQALERVG
jgi:hypothetical protein